MRDKSAASPVTLIGLVIVALLAFAGNSVLCRLALSHTSIDATSFTGVRLVSGALMMAALILGHRRWTNHGMSLPATCQQIYHYGSWLSALVLFIYALFFSLAYTGLSTATGALLLFGVVQATMISAGLYRGERLHHIQKVGGIIAFIGLCVLLLPGVETPSPVHAGLMMISGIAWGVFSLQGRRSTSAALNNAGNFLRALLFMAIAWVIAAVMQALQFDANGLWLAIASGALTSGLGYYLWYQVLPSLSASVAGTLQLSVPVIAAVGGVMFVSEPLTWCLVIASVTILGGIGLMTLTRKKNT